MAQWKIVRIELAPTPSFPSGSAGRSYILRLPILKDGMIDEQARAASPEHATVRRFWPNEPDLSGYVVRDGARWAFSCELRKTKDKDRFRLENQAIVLGECVRVISPNDARDPFRVVSLEDD